MVSEVSQRPDPAPVIQFSVFSDNKVGRLNELVLKFAIHDLHILAISQLDTTECTIIRVIVNYPEPAGEVLRAAGYSFTETEMLVVEMETEDRFRFVTAALVEAEINIHYLYPFLMRPQGRTALALHLEDNDLAASVLQAHGLTVLDQRDLGR